jgi:ferredoxin
MKLIIEDHCIRCGICNDICGDLFEKDEANDVMRVKFDEIPDSLKRCAQEAFEGCAVAAIRIVE